MSIVCVYKNLFHFIFPAIIMIFHSLEMEQNGEKTDIIFYGQFILQSIFLIVVTKNEIRISFKVGGNAWGAAVQEKKRVLNIIFNNNAV
jgi:hypothetical protein